MAFLRKKMMNFDKHEHEHEAAMNFSNPFDASFMPLPGRFWRAKAWESEILKTFLPVRSNFFRSQFVPSTLTHAGAVLSVIFASQSHQLGFFTCFSVWWFLEPFNHFPALGPIGAWPRSTFRQSFGFRLWHDVSCCMKSCFRDFEFRMSLRFDIVESLILSNPPQLICRRLFHGQRSPKLISCWPNYKSMARHEFLRLFVSHCAPCERTAFRLNCLSILWS